MLFFRLRFGSGFLRLFGSRFFDLLFDRLRLRFFLRFGRGFFNLLRFRLFFLHRFGLRFFFLFLGLGFDFLAFHRDDFRLGFRFRLTLQGDALLTTEGTFLIAIAAAGEEVEADRAKEGADAEEDQTPPAIAHLGPIGQPNGFAHRDPVVTGFARIMGSDDAEDNEDDAE